MTENADQFSEASKAEEHLGEPGLQKPTVSLELSSNLVTLLQQHSYQSGQTQTEAILAILQSALEQPALGTDAKREAILEQSLSASVPIVEQELQLIKARLRQLEALIPRLEELEGKWTAF